MTNDVIDLKDKVVHINSDGKIVADNSTISENFNYITYKILEIYLSTSCCLEKQVDSLILVIFPPTPYTV